MARRRLRSQPFSLFAFQDIITAVCGIMILTTLVLAIQLIDRLTNPIHVAPTSMIPAELASELQQLRSEISRVNVEISENVDQSRDVAALTPLEVEREMTARTRDIDALKAALQRAERQSLELDQRSLDATSTASSTVKKKTAQLDALTTNVHRLQTQIESLKAGDQLIFNPDPLFTKEAWLLDVGRDRLVVSLIGGGSDVHRFGQSSQSQRLDALLRWAGQLDSRLSYFVIILRPTGIPAYPDVVNELGQRGFDYGTDLVAEDVTVRASMPLPEG